jgi:hypothetical protein
VSDTRFSALTHLRLSPNMEKLVRSIDPFVGDGNISSFPSSTRNYDKQPKRHVLCINIITLGEKYIVDKERLGGGKNKFYEK